VFILLAVGAAPASWRALQHPSHVEIARVRVFSLHVYPRMPNGSTVRSSKRRIKKKINKKKLERKSFKI